MKRDYSKPQIIIENFELVQNIALGCGAAHDSNFGSPTHSNKSVCGWEIMDGLIAWTSEANGCNDIFGIDDEFNGVCYNNPGDGATIFSS